MTDTLSITSVGYSRLVSLGNYENEKVTASARVEEGEDADAVLNALKAWVRERVADMHESHGLYEKVSEMKWEVQQLERKLAEAKAKWAAAQRFLAAHGIDLSEGSVEDLPF